MSVPRGRQSRIGSFFTRSMNRMNDKVSSHKKQKQRQPPAETIILLSDSDNDDNEVEECYFVKQSKEKIGKEQTVTMETQSGKERNLSNDTSQALCASTTISLDAATLTSRDSIHNNDISSNRDSDATADDQNDDANNQSSSQSSTFSPPVNPFAKFAAVTESSASRNKRPSPIDFSQWTAPPKKKPTKSASTTTAAAANNKRVRMEDLSKDEQERVVDKWHSMVVISDDDNDGNPASSCSMEDRRWQILVAARLHARCQEGPVRQALQRLHGHLVPAHGPTLSVHLLATVDPDEWTEAIRNLQYYPTKARHIHQAARQIVRNFGGQVPERDDHLQTLTGIGPVLADLLAFVNTRHVHQARARTEIADSPQQQPTQTS